MGKTPLILAPIILIVFALWLAVWTGRRLERAAMKLRAEHLDPQLHTDLANLVRDMLHPTDLNDIPYLPPTLKQRAIELSAEATRQEKARDRAKRRRLGW